MPPKKQQVQEKIRLGRPGNTLKSGIVGLANVGKSTLFQAITKSTLGNPGNFPFATINPEESTVIVPDERYDWLCQYYKPKSQVPAILSVYDIAGLIKGASTGLGLGNAFLSHISVVDGIFQMVRCFDDKDITHVEGDVNPIRDLDIISSELRIKDIQTVQNSLAALKKETRRGGQSLEMKKLKEAEATTETLLEWLQEGDGKGPKPDDKDYQADMNYGKDVHTREWSPKEVEVINPLGLLTAKPVVYLANMSEEGYILATKLEQGLIKLEDFDTDQKKLIKHAIKVKKWMKDNAPDSELCFLSAAFEHRLSLMEDDAAALEECKRLNTYSALPKIITTMRAALDLASFFTTGEDEVRQWTIRKGIKAPAAAGVIHTDFEKTFIQAIAYNYSVLREYGDEASVKAAGKIMTKGKDYVVNDGDILLIKAGAAKK